MDDTSRNGEAHYGIGLFFAKTVAEKYGGGIKLSSSENTGGARVEIFFLSSQETS
jgi:signal transduction histidine kinase